MSGSKSFTSVLSGLLEDTMVVLDVREKAERTQPGRIPGTKSVPSEYRGVPTYFFLSACLPYESIWY